MNNCVECKYVVDSVPFFRREVISQLGRMVYSVRYTLPFSPGSPRLERDAGVRCAPPQPCRESHGSETAWKVTQTQSTGKLCGLTKVTGNSNCQFCLSACLRAHRLTNISYTVSHFSLSPHSLTSGLPMSLMWSLSPPLS